MDTPELHVTAKSIHKVPFSVSSNLRFRSRVFQAQTFFSSTWPAMQIQIPAIFRPQIPALGVPAILGRKGRQTHPPPRIINLMLDFPSWPARIRGLTHPPSAGFRPNANLLSLFVKCISPRLRPFPSFSSPPPVPGQVVDVGHTHLGCARGRGDSRLTSCHALPYLRLSISVFPVQVSRPNW